MRIEGLRCEYSDEALGIDVRQPRLSWRMTTRRRGARQAAYQVLAGVEAAPLRAGQADLWDSGRIESGDSVFVEYGGVPPASRQRVWWTVRVWDERGERADAEPAWFEMGLLERGDWLGQWIGADLVGGPRSPVPCPHLRKGFRVQGQVARARLYVTALGIHRTSLNGRRTSDEELSPGWTDFHKRVRYSVHDVTGLLVQGENVLGAILGDGWYAGHLEKRSRQLYGERPLLLAQLEVEYADGRRQVVASDESWRVGFGPILASDLIMGEEYDARLEMPGWDAPLFDDSRWQPARVFPDRGAQLDAYDSPPIRPMGELPAVGEPRRTTGGWIFDLGQNMVGRVRLKVSASRGTTVRLRYGEMLDADGSLYTANLRTARATDYYTCRGGGEETWESHFTFHGFRYVELTGPKEPPAADAVTGVVLHSAWELAGQFECSEPLVNQLHHNVVWGWKGNSLDVPTDCPQRDERLGWTGDAQVFVAAAARVADVNGFFAKWLRDIRDAQTADGEVAALVPSSHLGGGWDGGPGWADATVICAWTMYQRYGDRRLLEEHWPSLKRWMDQQQRTSRDGVRAYDGGPTGCFGDWLALDGSAGSKGATPHDLIGTAFYANAAATMARIAGVLGEADDQRRYSCLAGEVAEAFRRHFMTPTGSLVSRTQTAAVLALHFGLAPAELRSAVADALEADIRGRGMLLSTGFLGTPYLLDVLAREGRVETAYALLLQKACPSWLFAVTHGATTIWERWDGWTAEKGFQNPGMNSFNHYAYGAVADWLYGSAAGIEPHGEGPPWRQIVLRPRISKALGWVRAAQATPYGPVESYWRREGERLVWTVTVPPSTSATAHVPCRDADGVLESGRRASRAEGVDVVGPRGAAMVCRLAAGQYELEWQE